MKLLLKFRQYCTILTAVPGKFRPRGIAVTENTSKVAVKTSLSRKKHFFLSLVSKTTNLVYCFFPGLRKRNFDGPS